MFTTDIGEIQYHWHPLVPHVEPYNPFEGRSMITGWDDEEVVGLRGFEQREARQGRALPRMPVDRRDALQVWWEQCLTLHNVRYGFFDAACIRKTASRIVQLTATIEAFPGVNDFTQSMRIAIRSAKVGIQELLHCLFERLCRQTANPRNAAFVPAVPVFTSDTPYAPDLPEHPEARCYRDLRPPQRVLAVHDASLPGGIPYSERWARTDESLPILYRVTSVDGLERHLRLRDMIDEERLRVLEEDMSEGGAWPADTPRTLRDLLYHGSKTGERARTIVDVQARYCSEDYDATAEERMLETFGPVYHTCEALGARCPAVFPCALLDFWEKRAQWARDMEFARHRKYIVVYVLQMVHHRDSVNADGWAPPCGCRATADTTAAGPSATGVIGGGGLLPFSRPPARSLTLVTEALKQPWWHGDPGIIPTAGSTRCKFDTDESGYALFADPENSGVAEYAHMCELDTELPRVDASGRTSVLAAWLTEYVCSLNRLCGFLPGHVNVGREADEDSAGYDDIDDWLQGRVFHMADATIGAGSSLDHIESPTDYGEYVGAGGGVPMSLPSIVAHRSTHIAYDFVRTGARVEVAVYTALWEVFARVLDSIRGRLRMAAFRQNWELVHEIALWPPRHEGTTAHESVPWPRRINSVAVSGPLPFWQRGSALRYASIDERATDALRLEVGQALGGVTRRVRCDSGTPAVLRVLEQLASVLVLRMRGDRPPEARYPKQALRQLALPETLRRTWRHALWAYYWDSERTHSAWNVGHDESDMSDAPPSRYDDDDDDVPEPDPDDDPANDIFEPGTDDYPESDSDHGSTPSSGSNSEPEMDSGNESASEVSEGPVHKSKRARLQARAIAARLALGRRSAPAITTVLHK